MDRFIIKKPRLDESAEESVSSADKGQSAESQRKHDAQKPSSSSKTTKGRHYFSAYLAMGFTFSGPDDKPNPECMICGDKLSNESMVPSKLKRHFSSKHGHMKDKSIEYFERMLSNYKKTGKTFTKSVTVPERALECSFIISAMITKEMTSHDIGEKLVKPACLEMVKRMVGEEAAKDIEKVPLSNSTVARRECEMSTDINESTVEKVKGNPFAIQLDESTDYTGKCYLIAFVRFVDNSDVCNQFLFLKEMTTTTTGKDVFETTDLFF